MTIKLNSAQLEAVRHKDGPVLVLAGPGSGKTTVICERVRFLIEEENISSNQILVLTYTKAAAESMSQRFQKNRPHRVLFLTIHSFCYHFLIQEFHKSSIHLISETGKFHLLQDILFQKGYIEERDEEITYEYLRRMLIESNNPEFDEVRNEYRRKKEAAGVMDYDDLLYETYDYLVKNENARKRWENRFSYLLVDEFQDVNYVQFQILTMLCGEHHNIMVVGDDDQAIYGFRGAHPGVMNEFLCAFPESKRILLSINYRCSKEIMKVAEVTIRNNKDRMDKSIDAVHEGEMKPIFCQYEDASTQYEEILRKILSMSKSEWHECAVLFRTGEECRRFIWQASFHGVSCGQSKWKISDFFVIEEITSYLDLICDKWELGRVTRVMNHPERGIERIYLNESVHSMEEWLSKLYVSYYKAQYLKVKEFCAEIMRMRTMSPYLGIMYLLKGIGYGDDVIKRLGNNSIAIEMSATFQEHILHIAKKKQSWNDLREEMIEEMKKQNITEHKDKISCMTYHGAKGLEFDTVFLPNINDGMVPLRKAVMADRIEEERRLFYVGITRARKRLEISYVRKDRNKEKKKSQFLTELGE